MKYEDAMAFIGMNKIHMRDMIYQNCLKPEELEQVQEKDKETVKKMLEKSWKNDYLILNYEIFSHVWD